MKKFNLITLSVFIVINSYLAFGNETENNDINIQPYEIYFDNETVSLFDDKETIENTFISNKVDIHYNKHDIVRYIEILDSDIETYKNINVGDSTNELKEAFKYEINQDDLYFVCFDKDYNEVKITENRTIEDNDIVINYKIENDVITFILISDGKYVRYGS